MFSKLKVFTRPALVFLIMLLASIPLSSQAPKYCVTSPDLPEKLLGNPGDFAKCGLVGSWDTTSGTCGGSKRNC